MSNSVKLVEIIHDTFFQLLIYQALEIGKALSENRKLLLLQLPHIPVHTEQNNTQQYRTEQKLDKKKGKNKQIPTRACVSSKAEILQTLKNNLEEQLRLLEE